MLVHPQSVVHGMVELVDGSLLMQAATDRHAHPDRRCSHVIPDRLEAPVPRVDLSEVGTLEFEAVDDGSFPAVKLAYEAGRAGGTAPAVLNAANETRGRERSSNGRLSFTGDHGRREGGAGPARVDRRRTIWSRCSQADRWAREAGDVVIAPTRRGSVAWASVFSSSRCSIVIMVHEAGHFTAAKSLGFKATKFFVGFGPTLWSRHEEAKPSTASRRSRPGVS